VEEGAREVKVAVKARVQEKPRTPVQAETLAELDDIDDETDAEMTSVEQPEETKAPVEQEQEPGQEAEKKPRKAVAKPKAQRTTRARKTTVRSKRASGAAEKGSANPDESTDTENEPAGG
ncbi:MAG: hypothetical protein R3268_04220, partial [Acidiferrobacterales bacterium]|nr:hypothetical protein [Acidiferrobacterales bacterium]